MQPAGPLSDAQVRPVANEFPNSKVTAPEFEIPHLVFPGKHFEFETTTV